MNEQELSRLLAVCTHTWPNHRVDDPEILTLSWTMILGEVSYPYASEALIRYMKDGNAFFPNPGELYQIVLDMTDALPTTSDAWNEVQARIASTYPGMPASEWTAPYPVRQAARAMGGINTLRMSENPMADRAHFIKFYEQYRQRAAREVNIAALIEHGAKALEPNFIGDGAGMRLLGPPRDETGEIESDHGSRLETVRLRP